MTVLYAITHAPTGRTYVGWTNHKPAVRAWWYHQYLANFHVDALHSAMREHGVDEFSFEEIRELSASENLREAHANEIERRGSVKPAGFNGRISWGPTTPRKEETADGSQGRG